MEKFDNGKAFRHRRVHGINYYLLSLFFFFSFRRLNAPISGIFISIYTENKNWIHHWLNLSSQLERKVKKKLELWTIWQYSGFWAEFETMSLRSRTHNVSRFFDLPKRKRFFRFLSFLKLTSFHFQCSMKRDIQLKAIR